MKKQYKKLTDLLPKGWREAAKSEKALQRSGRYIKTADDLLKVDFLYLTEGASFGQTAALLQITGEYPLTKNAVYERVTNSGDWLKWMCEHLCHENGYIVEKPEWLEEYRVCLVDATNTSRPGSSGADYRLHYLIELFHLNMVEMHLTSAAEGETITRYQKLKEKDLILGDRAYGRVKGITYARKHHADYIFRLKADAFTLYTGEHEKFDLARCLEEEWAPGKLLDLHLYYQDGNGYSPVRVCALGKTMEQIKKSERQIKKSNRQKMRGKISPLQAVFNRFVVVITSLPDNISADQIFQLYRMRWQIEMVFKRMKSIFDIGNLTSFKDQSVFAWFYGKLLLSGLCEILVNRGSFSPAENQEFL